MQQVALSKKRVRIIYVGGLAEIAGQPPSSVETYFQRYQDLQLLVRFDIDVISNATAANTSWQTVETISQHIQDSYDDYDGFVIFHPIESAVYTANLLNFASTPFGKPVVFTGPSTLPIIHHDERDKHATKHSKQEILRATILSSIQLATLDCSGILLGYNLVAMEAAIASPNFTNNSMGFTPLKIGNLADMQFGITFSRMPKSRFDTPITPLLEYSTAVQIHTLHPGQQLDLRNSTAEGLLINGFAHTAVPDGLQLPTDIPVVIISRGKIKKSEYSNVTVVSHLPLPICYTKMMVGVKATSSPQEFVKWFSRVQRNEVKKG